ncbi:hypothetical protein LP420_11750 [Massilia sp. B-10]|nr:hypothetical protein LP420_11750 [Massilia sp. B-10]
MQQARQRRGARRRQRRPGPGGQLPRRAGGAAGLSSYHGQCGGGAAEISVSPAGLVRAAGFEHDLNGENVSLSLSRTLAQGQPSGLEVRTGGAAPQWAFALVSGPGEWASVEDGSTTLKCEQVAQLTALRPKALYPQVASFFSKAPASLECAGSGNGQIEPGLQQVAPGAHRVTIGKASLAFDHGIKSETVMFAPGQPDPDLQRRLRRQRDPGDAGGSRWPAGRSHVDRHRGRRADVRPAARLSAAPTSKERP